MPFKSEKQRKYLWANEPEIARDWTDTYGSGIHKAKGGRIGLRYGMSPGRSQAQYGHAGHAGKTPTQAHRDQREGRDVQQGTQHITGGSADLARQEQAAAAEKKRLEKAERINAALNKYIPGRTGQNTKLRGGYIDKNQDVFDALLAQGLIKETGGVGAWDWVGPGGLESQAALEALQGLKYTGGYHDVNDPGHPNYDPRGGGEGQGTDPWLYPQGGIASTGGGSTPFDLGLTGGGDYLVPLDLVVNQTRAADGGRIPAAFGGIMDSETGRRGYGFGSFNPFKAVKKAVKSGIKGVKKLAKSKLGKMALAYLATAGASNYLAGAQGSFGLGAPGGQAWKSMKWLTPSNVGANIGTGWDRAASFLSPASKTVADKTVTTAGQGLPWYKDPWKVIPAASIASGYFADKMPADDIDDGTEKWDAEKAKWDRFYANLDDEDSYRVPEDLRAAQGGRIGYDKGGSTWREFLKDQNVVVDPSDKSWRDTYYRWLDQQKNKAQGGRIGRQEGGLMDLGGMEKDYREDGGFVPLGGEEKADDVPARLSRNEFVFTADAVRNAGGGDIDKGAEVMENVMKNLEAGGRVSEESQGQGAQDMFEVSERLSEVV